MRWEKVKDFPNYEVSDHGMVRNIQNKKILKGTEHNGKQPYLYVTLRKDGVSHKNFIHRIVAKTFILNPEHKEQVNHIDGNVQNNNLDNLEWVTNSENTQHAYDTGLNSKSIQCQLIKDGEIINFHSMKKLSNYLGKYNGWLWSKIKTYGNEFQYEDYFIKVVM